MNRPGAPTVAKVASVCTGGLFFAGLVSCGMSGIGQGGSLAAALTGFLLHVLALAALIVWLTARDIAADQPPEATPPRPQANGPE